MTAKAGTVDETHTGPNPVPLDERVLAAGTTLRFGLLLVLLAAAGLRMVPSTVWHLLVSSGSADHEAACWLAAGIDPGSALNAGYDRYTRNATALHACLEQYGRSFDWESIAAGALLLATAVATYCLLPVWRTRRARLSPVDSSPDLAQLREKLDELVTVAGLARRPRFVVESFRPTATAVVFGRWGRTTVCLHDGLVVTAGTDPSRFRSVVLHELAHVRNGDVGITYATVALWRVFLMLVLLPWAVVGLDNLLFAETASARAQYAPFNTHELVLAVLLVVSAYLTRAGILRNREIHADLTAARWGADRRSWDVTTSARSGGLGTGRLAAFAELWRTHPSWALRRSSLADPKALFALDGLQLLLAGLAVDILAWQLGSVSSTSLPLRELLLAGFLVGIGGTALWRAVVYAAATRQRPPSGEMAGLWLGGGVAVGELAGPGAAWNHWWPPHPEALLVLVAGLVLAMSWTAQHAGLRIRSWRGRTLGPTALASLITAALAFAAVLCWWFPVGQSLTDGWPFTTRGLLASYGLPGLPPDRVGPLLSTIAVVDVLPGSDNSVVSLWWAVPLLWLLPMLTAAARTPLHRPPWLERALPGADGRLLSQPSGPGWFLTTGLLGGLLCCGGLALAAAWLHTPSPAAVRMTGPFQLTYLMLPVLVVCAAMAATALIAAAMASPSWLLGGLIAAGTTALAGILGAFLLMGADGCLGPLNTMTSTCDWRPGVVWPLVRIIVVHTLTLGTFAAALAAFAGRGARLLWRFATRREAAAAGSDGGRAAGAGRRTTRAAARVFATTGVALTAVVLAQTATASGSTETPEWAADRPGPALSGPAALQAAQAWAAVGGLDLLDQLYTAERSYYTSFDRVLASAPGTGLAEALQALGATCDGLTQIAERAEAFFTVPVPEGQQLWSQLILRYSQLGTACRTFADHPDSASALATDSADDDLVNSADAVMSWLAESGAIHPSS